MNDKEKAELRKKLEIADRIADEVIQKMMLGAGALAFIPGGGFLISTIVDFAMVERIASAYGVGDFNYEQLMTAIGAMVAGQLASTVLLSFIPVLGWAINSGVAATVTKLAGEMIKEEFRKKSRYNV